MFTIIDEVHLTPASGGTVLPFRHPSGSAPRIMAAENAARSGDGETYSVRLSAADLAVVTAVRRSCIAHGTDVDLDTVLRASLHAMACTPTDLVAEFITEHLLSSE